VPNDTSPDPNQGLADRVRKLRKLRDLNQAELAAAADLSLRTIKTIEQGGPVRLKTLSAVAKGLSILTADLLTPGVPEQGDPLRGDPWSDVRDALYRPRQIDEPADTAAVLAGLAAARPDLAANRYDSARALLPGLIRDSAALDGGSARDARARVLNMTAWLLTQNRQWDDALAAGRLSMDAARDPVDKVAAANTLCWCLLRQGRLAEAGALAEKWADETEPRRFSRASHAELAGWGKLWLYVTNARVRNNEPGAAEDALRIAEAAASRIGREVETDSSTTRTFGPVTVPMIAAENAAITGKPDQVLAIHAQIAGRSLVHAMSASVLRHDLDVGLAHAQLRQYGEAVDVLDGIRRKAPQWLRVQRTARDLMETVVDRRRKLTPQMRQVAAAVQLDL
jgi:transcriptional regulator with XRE-family HTH domain